MASRWVRLAGLMLIAAAVAGCDKCADNYLANPFAPSKPATCHEGPAPK